MKHSRAAVHRKVHKLPALRFEQQTLTSYGGLVLLQALLGRLQLKDACAPASAICMSPRSLATTSWSSCSSCTCSWAIASSAMPATTGTIPPPAAVGPHAPAGRRHDLSRVGASRCSQRGQGRRPQPPARAGPAAPSPARPGHAGLRWVGPPHAAPCRGQRRRLLQGQERGPQLLPALLHRGADGPGLRCPAPGGQCP